MSFHAPQQSSIFLGNWEKQGSGGQTLLVRRVKVGNKSYRMTVGYNVDSLVELDNPTQAERVIKQVMEKSEEQIANFLQSYSSEPQKLQHVTLKTDIKQRTGSVALKTFGSSNESNLTLSDLKNRNIQEFQATGALINAFNQYYTQTVKKEKVEVESLSIGFEPVKGKTKDPFLAQAKSQLETLLQQIEPIETLIDEHGIKRWPKVEIDGIVYEVKEFKEGAYNGAKTTDFIRRQQLVFAAVMQYINTEISDSSQLMEKVSQLSSAYIKKIEDTCDLKKDLMQKGIEGTQHVNEINRQAVELIAQFTKDAQYIINTATGKEDCEISRLAELEKEIILERDRPVIVNIYHHEGKRFVNMQAPQREGGKTIPSTIRDRPGLVNYVNTVFGEIDDGGHVDVKFHAIRHSSYPPIAIKDDIQRQAIAIKNVKEGIARLAKTQLKTRQSAPTKEDPLVVPLRTMMLLTPIKGDSVRNRKGIRGKWTGESESLQLKEAVLALSVMRGRVMQLEVDGEKVWLKADISMMNLGANKEAAGMGFGKLPLDPLQERINARGYFTFLEDIENDLMGQDLPSPLGSYIQQIRELEKSGFEQPDETLIHQEYEKLEKEYEKANPDKKIIRALKKGIQEEERKIYDSFLAQLAERKKALNMNKAEIAQIQAQFLTQISKEIEKTTDVGERLRLTYARDLFQNFVLAKQYFDNEAYKKPDTVMEFQTLYIQMESMIGNLIELFCKSAEDRTGRVDNKVQERLIFRFLSGRQAITEGDLREVYTKIAPVVLQFSVSKDNTTYNSESPGLQITPEVNRHIPAAIDKKQATMAKRVISRAAKLSPSSFAVGLASRL